MRLLSAAILRRQERAPPGDRPHGLGRATYRGWPVRRARTHTADEIPSPNRRDRRLGLGSTTPLPRRRAPDAAALGFPGALFRHAPVRLPTTCVRPLPQVM